jgi:ribosomal protein S18 acetylase RimI-like enzyme
MIAEDAAGTSIGAAWYRIYGEGDRGNGIVAWPGAPELAIGVRPDGRGAGAGRALLDALARAARDAGYARLVLSVDPRNPARRLYERCGYRVVPEGDPHAGGSLIMELAL